MSLLEDVFLQDEANEAEELERVIEGDEFEERRRSDSDEDSEKEDEAEEDKRKVDPSKPKHIRVVKNPRVLLNPARLTGPRGIQIIPDHFKDFKFKGKGHEKEDLDFVLKKLEHWAYRLYPKFQFEDCLKKIEILGKKRPVAVHLHKIRSDQFRSEDTVVQKDSSDEDTPMPVQEDEFDKLLQQQIELARSTPTPSSAKKLPSDRLSPFKDNRFMSLTMPKATCSPSISEEQRERMLRSRKLAEERILARLKNAASNIVNNSELQSQDAQIVHIEEKNAETIEINGEPNNEMSKDTDEIGVVRKHNKSNVIDSSDDESVVETNVSIAVDVHTDIGNNAECNKDPGKSAHINLNDNEDIEGIEMDKICDNNETISESNTNVNNSNRFAVTEDRTIQNINEKDSIPCRSKDNIDAEETVKANVDATGINGDNSGTYEELRYDDSDMNIDTNDQSIEDKSAFALSNDNASHSGNLDSGNLIGDNSDKSKDTENSIGTSDNVKNIDNVSEQVLDDIMDVDFSEDF